MTLPIITIPNPILRKKAKKIALKDIKTAEFQKLIDDMSKTMKKDGIGLAAPQINKSIRLIIVSHKDGPLAMINPQITYKSFRKETDQEGCLSIPNTFGDVKRSKTIKAKYTDREGKEILLKAQGLLARVIQHEVDHLDGVLFIDKAKNVKENVK